MRTSMTDVIVARSTMEHLLHLAGHSDIFAHIALEAVVRIWRWELTCQIKVVAFWALPLISTNLLQLYFLVYKPSAACPAVYNSE